jgi:NAD(P)-dependent dehydrogenase (short-subunit alcohol dehydrogenase family)
LWRDHRASRPEISMHRPSPFSLKDKAIFITGGSSGIGLGQSLRFLQEGARVAVADIQAPPQAALEDGLLYIPCDVTVRDQVIASFEAAVTAIGRLDVISHNAGKPGKGTHLTDSNEEVLDGVVALNVYGTYYVLKYGPKHMRDGGSIITTASVAGLQQNEGFFDYSATKAATISMTKTAAVELGRRGIRCNAVAPGPVKTPMLPPGHILNTLAKQLSALGRIAEVDDLVGVYHFLASDQSRYITGHTLIVDGGRLTGFRTEVLARLAD